jgi:hypothetical protein
MDDWQSTPSSNNIIIIVVIVLVIVGIIILLIAVWNSGTSNTSNNSSQQSNIKEDDNDDDDDTPFDSGSTSTKASASSKSNSNKPRKSGKNTINPISNLPVPGSTKVTPDKSRQSNNPTQGTPTNPLLVNPNVPVQPPVPTQTFGTTASVNPLTLVQPNVPSPSMVPTQTFGTTGLVNPVNLVQPNVPSPSMVPTQTFGTTGLVNPINLIQPSDTIKQSIPVNNLSDGSSKDSIPVIEDSLHSMQPKEDSIPKISGSTTASEVILDTKSKNSTSAENKSDTSVISGMRSDATNTSGNNSSTDNSSGNTLSMINTSSSTINPSLSPSSGAISSSNNSENFEELAREEALASVEDMSVYNDNGTNSSSGTVVKSSMPEHIISNMNASSNQEPIKENSIPRPLVPQPPKIQLYNPPIKGSGNNSLMDETSGFSVDASMTNPASLSSDFSSPTDKSTRPQRKHNISNQFAAIANLAKPTSKGRGKGNNPRMGPFQ